MEMPLNENGKRVLKFEGVDFWGRPIFKDSNNARYGSTDKLFHFEATAEEVLEHVTESDLRYFGKHFGCEPDGSRIDPKKIILKA